MCVALIVNTVSVNPGDAAGLERAVRASLSGAIVLRTRAAARTTQLARDAIESGAQRIVLADGDGTVREAANAAIGSQVELAAVPCGTGNDFSRSLGMPRDLEGALEVALRGSPRLAPVRISVDGELLGTFPNSNLIVGNGGYFGCGLRPLPQACLDDGLLDIAHIRDASRIETALEARELKNGIRPDHPKVDQRRCRILHAERDEYVGVEADGELLGCLPATFRVLPRALRFVHAG